MYQHCKVHYCSTLFLKNIISTSKTCNALCYCNLKYSKYCRTCGECRMDIACGYCYEELSSSSVVNGSCLVTSPDDWLHSTEGRCNSYSLQNNSTHNLVWAYDFCPTELYWLPMVGLVMYLVFFAPG